jgi:cephalosporin hydroxylase
MSVNPRDPKSHIPSPALASIQDGVMGYKYKGIPCFKNPFDFTLYTQLIYEVSPRTIIEIGSNAGGSALWLADILRNFGIDGSVISIDLTPVTTVEDRMVRFLPGNALDLGATLTPNVLEALPRPWLVIEDSAHFYETSLAVLEFFDQHQRSGEYILVEDGIVNDLDPAIYGDYKNGPNNAIFDFLARSDGRYIIDERYCDYYGHNFTYNTNGYLKRVKS